MEKCRPPKSPDIGESQLRVPGIEDIGVMHGKSIKVSPEVITPLKALPRLEINSVLRLTLSYSNSLSSSWWSCLILPC